MTAKEMAENAEAIRMQIGNSNDTKPELYQFTPDEFKAFCEQLLNEFEKQTTGENALTSWVNFDLATRETSNITVVQEFLKGIL